MALNNRSTRPALPFITQTGISTGTFNSGDFQVDNFDQLAIDINVSAISGTGPTITFIYQRKGADGVYYSIWIPTAISTVSAVSTSIGIGGPTNHSVGFIGRLQWTVAGTGPSVTFTASIYGK